MTRSVRRLALALLVALAPGVGAMAETIVLKADRYLDVGAGRMVEPAVIVVRDGIIAAINPAAVPEADQVLELPGMTLLPGLMDAHTHITADVSRGWQYAAVRRTAADYALVGAVNAGKTLQAGFTTVRDLGAAHFADVAVAQAIESGLIPGPEIIAAGNGIGSTGGHCDVTGFAPGVLETDWRYGVADGADEVAKALRYQVKHGARVVKLCATAGVMSHEASVGAQQLDAAELAAAVAEAGRHGLKVAAHAVGTEGIVAAAQAGVDSIEHASMLTPAAAKLIRERGTRLVFTLYLYEAIDPAMLPPAMLAKGMAIREVSRQSFQLALRENLRIVFGTDAGVYPHGDNAREFATRVRLGQSPLEAIRSATLYASELLGVPDRGQVREGLRADLIAVAGDPLARIEALQAVGFVMKAGRIHRQP
jgi:imidazolonepropionase-like amidohydrolase